MSNTGADNSLPLPKSPKVLSSRESNVKGPGGMGFGEETGGFSGWVWWMWEAEGVWVPGRSYVRDHGTREENTGKRGAASYHSPPLPLFPAPFEFRKHQ